MMMLLKFCCFSFAASLLLVNFYSSEGCPYSRSRDENEIHHRKLLDSFHKIGLLSKPFKNGVCFKTNGRRITSPNSNNICNAYLSTKATLRKVMPQDNDTFALADIYAKAIRLAFHDAAEFDKSSSDLSGPDGCLSNSLLNKGLIEPTSLVNTFIEPLWQSVCDQISRADFWALFAKIMAEEAALPGKLNIPFSYGRQDSSICPDYNRLPDAQKGINEIVDLFVTRMGLTLADGVVLQGSHSVGHVHQNVSGYFLENPGTYIPVDPSSDVTVNAWDTTPAVLDNNYFISMFIIGWASVKEHASNGKLNIWFALTGPVIALNTDMAVGFTIDVPPPHFGADIAGNFANGGDIGQVCIQSNQDFPEVDNFIPCRPIDAGIGFYPCQYGCTRYNTPFSYVGINTTKPSTFDQVMAYTQSNDLFLKDYALAFARMMNVGYGASPSNPGKLGYLTAIDLDSCNLPLCQFAGMCSKSSDCTLGNKCVFSDHYSQCVADPTTYFSSATCVSNFAGKCTSTADCCDPGAYCDVSNSYPQCKQPVSSTGRCVDSLSPTASPTRATPTPKPSSVRTSSANPSIRSTPATASPSAHSKICQWGGYCRSTADCVAGNKCSTTNLPYYSQCIPDATTYASTPGSIGNYANKCSSTSNCADPGAFCDLAKSYPQCHQPTEGSGLCVSPKSFASAQSSGDSISVSATINEHEPSGIDGDGLSVGLIAAIVLAGLAFLSVVAVAMIWFFRSKRSQKLDLKTFDEDMNGVEIIY